MAPCDDRRVLTLSPLIREATALDAAAIARVRVLAWRAAYRGIIDDAYLAGLSIEAGTERYLRGFAPDPAAAFTRVIADDSGRVTGFATAGIARGRAPARRGEIYLLYLLPDTWRQGLGTRLVRSMARGLDRRGMASMVVWSLARNERACRFYERLGGRPIDGRETPVGAQRLAEVAYGWDDLAPLLD